MKKTVPLLTLIALCAAATYSYLKPDAPRYLDESDFQAYSNRDLLDGIDIPEKKKKKNPYHAVRHYEPRKSTLGYSITPPPGTNWFEKLENDSLYYLKINKSHKRYSILTEAREVLLDRELKNAKELQSYVQSEKEKAVVSSDFKNLRVNVQHEPSPSQNCVRYSQSYQDHGWKGLRKGSHVNVDTRGLFCLHPDDGRVAVDVSYVEKSLSNTVANSYSTEGEQFLASLTFQQVNRK
jgi:hypothetical protein